MAAVRRGAFRNAIEWQWTRWERGGLRAEG